MSPAATILYGIIRSAVETQATTPIMLDMKATLAEAGISLSRPQIAQIIRGLADDGLIVTRNYEKSGNVRYGLPDSALMTAYRSYSQHGALPRPGRPSDATGWPRPTEASRAAYDANMKLGAPIRVVGRPDSQRPMPRCTSPGEHSFSLTGNAAEMCELC